MTQLSKFTGVISPKWVTGTQYQEGFVVWSPTDFQYYMRKITGAGATDPVTDTTNWQPTGDRAIKSIQRGVITLASGAVTNTATITAVATGKTETRMLGNSSTDLQGNGARIVLTNTTTITATKAGATAACDVSWEITEKY